jgi:hypothetical protein
MPGARDIERCAAVCDQVVFELKRTKETARKNRYDRQTGRMFDYAIRAVQGAAAKIRKLQPLVEE